MMKSTQFKHKRPSSRNSSLDRSLTKKHYDYKCEWDLPKGADLTLAMPQPFDLYKPTLEQMSLMPDFGFFKKIK